MSKEKKTSKDSGKSAKTADPHKAEAKSTDSKTKSSDTKKDEKKPKSKPKTTGSSEIKNGKGSGPRNMGPEFLDNFGKIRWESHKKKRPQAGTKFVKKY
ncbi:MAG: hypothetical protein AAGA18_02645 [Verrucomicrobiota bacterium]